MKPIDTLGLRLNCNSRAEAEQLAEDVRDWLNERYERGYRLSHILGCLYSAVLIVERPVEHDPLEHGD